MRILIFIGLKLLEIAGIVLCVGVCFALVPSIVYVFNTYTIVKIIFALLYLALVGLFLGILCFSFIKANWKKAGEIEQKIKKRSNHV